jgi:hypothetical protein
MRHPAVPALLATMALAVAPMSGCGLQRTQGGPTVAPSRSLAGSTGPASTASAASTANSASTASSAAEAPLEIVTPADHAELDLSAGAQVHYRLAAAPPSATTLWIYVDGPPPARQVHPSALPVSPPQSGRRDIATQWIYPAGLHALEYTLLSSDAVLPLVGGKWLPGRRSLTFCLADDGQVQPATCRTVRDLAISGPK